MTAGLRQLTLSHLKPEEKWKSLTVGFRTDIIHEIQKTHWGIGGEPASEKLKDVSSPQ